MSRRLLSTHSWLGLIGGLFLFVIGTAGAILVFTDDIDAILHPAIACTPSSAKQATLNEILANTKAKYPDANVTGVRLGAEEPGTAYTVLMNRKGKLWFAQADPYSGAVLSAREADGSFTRQVLALHRSFFFRPWGEALVGIFALVLFLSALTGVIIFRKSLLRPLSSRLRWNGSMGILAGDLHRLIGTLAFIFNLIMSITGFYIISPVYKRIVSPEPPRNQKAMPMPTLSLDSLVDASTHVLPGFSPRMVSLPNAKGKPIRIAGTVDHAGVMYGKASSSVSFDAVTGKVTEKVDISEASFGAKLEQIVRSVHFGQYGALPVKIIYAIGGLTPGILSITGALIWFRKLRRKRARARAQAGKRGKIEMALGGKRLIGQTGEVCEEGGLYRSQIDGSAVRLAAGETFPAGDSDIAVATTWVRVGG